MFDVLVETGFGCSEYLDIDKPTDLPLFALGKFLPTGCLSELDFFFGKFAVLNLTDYVCSSSEIGVFD